MSTFYPERLRSARIRAGLSLRKLSERMENRVSYNAIKKYEDGKMAPDPSVLLSLADILQVELAYFSRSQTLSLKGLEFRKKSRLTNRQINQIKEETLDLLERYLEVEKLSGIQPKFQNPIQKFKIQSEEDIEKDTQT